MQIRRGLVCLLWQTAPFVFLAASARTGIVPLWFHERFSPAALPRKRDLIRLARLASDRRARTSQAPMSFYFFVKIRSYLRQVLSSVACRVKFFLGRDWAVALFVR